MRRQRQFLFRRGSDAKCTSGLTLLNLYSIRAIRDQANSFPCIIEVWKSMIVVDGIELHHGHGRLGMRLQCHR